MNDPGEMWVAVLRVDVLVPGARSLKDKRQVLRSMKERLKNRFDVACAEVGDRQSWNRGSLGLSAVSNERAALEELAAAVTRYVQNDPGALVTGIEKDISPYISTV
jgi:hypothetical protein